MATGLKFSDLTTAVNINNLLGAAEESSGTAKGQKFQYSNDGTLTSNSDAKVPTQKAVKTYADTKAADNTVVHLAGTETITGNKTLSGTTTLSALTASQLLATDVSKNITNITFLPNGTTATTQSAGDNTTKVATTAYVDSAISGENLWNRTGTTLSPHNAGDDVSLGTGGLKDNDVTVAISLGDSINTSFNTTNKTIVGAVNEVAAAVPTTLWDRTGTTLSPQNIGDDISTGTGGLKDNDVTTAVALGDSSNTSFSTTNKTIIGATNELYTTKAADSTVVHLAGTETITGNKTLSGTVNLSALTASQLLATNSSKNIVNITDLPNGTTATTQALGDDSTKVATTAFVQDAVGGESCWTKTDNTILPIDLLNDVQIGDPHRIFTALYSNSINADSSVTNSSSSLTATSVGGAAIADFSGTNKLDLTHNDVRYITYNATETGSLATQTGTFNFLITPNYTNAPANPQTFFSISRGTGDNRNYIELQHYNLPGPTAALTLKIYDYTGTPQVDTALGLWYPFAGTEYQFELDFDGTTGATRLFIDGTQFGATQTNTFGRDTNIGLLAIGQSTVSPGTNTNFAIRKFLMFDRVLHTANYTGRYSLTKLNLYETTDVKGQLHALTRSANDNSTNVATTEYVDRAGTWNVTDGVLSPNEPVDPIEIGNGSSIFGASYEITIDGDYITLGYEENLAATAVGGAAIAELGGIYKLDLAHNDLRYIYYNAHGNVREARLKGAMKFLITPAYNGNPVGDNKVFISIADTAATSPTPLLNLIDLRHIKSGEPDQGNLLLTFTDHLGAVQLNALLGVWNPISGVEYEFELNYDVTGDIRLFINGVQFGSTNTVSFSRSSEINVFYIGSGVDLAAEKSNFALRNLIVYNTVQHTTNYVPGYLFNKLDIYKSTDFYSLVSFRGKTYSLGSFYTFDGIYLNATLSAGGIYFNLPSGSGSGLLNMYKRNADIPIRFTGPWEGEVTVNVRCERIGHTTSIFIPTIHRIGVGAGPYIEALDPIPEIFRPVDNVFMLVYYDSGLSDRYKGFCYFNTNGIIIIKSQTDDGFVPNVGGVTIYPTTYVLTNP